ncbi:MAG: flagellar hook-associated protein FlgK [Desulfobacterales bacterium]|nr:flagellar hook-associated protein FlgK [Desulfobacterales bacterium]
MAGIGVTLDIAKIALSAQQLGLAVTGHNIANVNTPEYSRQTIPFDTALPFSINSLQLGRGVDVQDIQRSSDQLLENRLIAEKSGLNAYKESDVFLQIMESLFNENSENGISNQLSAFWNTWQDLSNNPTESPERTAVYDQGVRISSVMNALDNDLYQLALDISGEIESAVDQVNSITQQIATLNFEIAKVEVNDNANDQRDQRNGLVTELAEFMDVYMFEQDNGYLTITTAQGFTLVNGTTNSLLQQDKGRVMWEGSQGYVDITDRINGGKLGGWLQFRDQDIAKYRTELDVLAREFIWGVNYQHSQGVGLEYFSRDLSGTYTTDSSGLLSTLDYAEKIDYEKDFEMWIQDLTASTPSYSSVSVDMGISSADISNWGGTNGETAIYQYVFNVISGQAVGADVDITETNGLGLGSVRTAADISSALDSAIATQTITVSGGTVGTQTVEIDDTNADAERSAADIARALNDLIGVTAYASSTTVEIAGISKAAFNGGTANANEGDEVSFTVQVGNEAQTVSFLIGTDDTSTQYNFKNALETAVNAINVANSDTDVSITGSGAALSLTSTRGQNIGIEDFSFQDNATIAVGNFGGSAEGDRVFFELSDDNAGTNGITVNFTRGATAAEDARNLFNKLTGETEAFYNISKTGLDGSEGDEVGFTLRVGTQTQALSFLIGDSELSTYQNFQTALQDAVDNINTVNDNTDLSINGLSLDSASDLSITIESVNYTDNAAAAIGNFGATAAGDTVSFELADDNAGTNGITVDFIKGNTAAEDSQNLYAELTAGTSADALTAAGYTFRLDTANDRVVISRSGAADFAVDNLRDNNGGTAATADVHIQETGKTTLDGGAVTPVSLTEGGNEDALVAAEDDGARTISFGDLSDTLSAAGYSFRLDSTNNRVTISKIGGSDLAINNLRDDNSGVSATADVHIQEAGTTTLDGAAITPVSIAEGGNEDVLAAAVVEADRTITFGGTVLTQGGATDSAVLTGTVTLYLDPDYTIESDIAGAAGGLFSVAGGTPAATGKSIITLGGSGAYTGFDAGDEISFDIDGTGVSYTVGVGDDTDAEFAAALQARIDAALGAGYTVTNNNTSVTILKDADETPIEITNFADDNAGGGTLATLVVSTGTGTGLPGPSNTLLDSDTGVTDNSSTTSTLFGSDGIITWEKFDVNGDTTGTTGTIVVDETDAAFSADGLTFDIAAGDLVAGNTFVVNTNTSGAADNLNAQVTGTGNSILDTYKFTVVSGGEIDTDDIEVSWSNRLISGTFTIESTGRVPTELDGMEINFTSGTFIEGDVFTISTSDGGSPSLETLSDYHWTLDSFKEQFDRAMVDAGLTGISLTTVNNTLNFSQDSSSYLYGFSDTEGNDSGLMAALGINTFFTGSNAGGMGVNEVMAIAKYIAAAKINADDGTFGVGDNSNAIAIADVQNLSYDAAQWTFTRMEEAESNVVSSTIEGYYRRMIGSLGVRVDSNTRSMEFSQVLVNKIQEQRDAISSVNLDEEMINLMKYQHAYSVAAKLITVADEMMGTLIGLR